MTGVADVLVLVDSLRDGLFALSSGVISVWGTTPLPVKASLLGDVKQRDPSVSFPFLATQQGERREEAKFQAARFLRIMSHPDLHFDLRELICSMVCDRAGFVPQQMISRSREELLGELRGLRNLTVAEKEMSGRLVPTMTFGVKRFLVAAAIFVLLQLGLSILVMFFVKFLQMM